VRRFPGGAKHPHAGPRGLAAPLIGFENGHGRARLGYTEGERNTHEAAADGGYVGGHLSGLSLWGWWAQFADGLGLLPAMDGVNIWL
jgi:hypothetical protein